MNMDFRRQLDEIQALPEAELPPHLRLLIQTGFAGLDPRHLTWGDLHPIRSFVSSRRDSHGNLPYRAQVSSIPYATMQGLTYLALGGLGDSIEQSPVVALLLSAIIGGLVGASIKFGFEDLLRPFVGWRRDTRKVVRRYTTPLLRSAEQLERRTNNFIHNESDDWFEKSEYFRLSTLYVFGEYFGWIRILERSFGFLPFESTRKGKKFYRRLHGVFRALTSHAYFREEKDQVKVGDSGIQRFMLTAMGEIMISPDQDQPIEFTVFVSRYANDAQFRRWFVPLEEFLRKAHPDDSLRWDRLILTGAHLRALICFLDPRGSRVRSRKVANLHRLQHRQAIAALRRDFPKLIRSQEEIEKDRRAATVT